MTIDPGLHQEQEALFKVTVVVEGSGLTDADGYEPKRRVTFGDEAESPETEESGPVEPDRVLEAVRKQVSTDKRRRSQHGKHSAGTYADPQPGDVLPLPDGLWIVTRTNLEESRRKGAQLQAERQQANRLAG